MKKIVYLKKVIIFLITFLIIITSTNVIAFEGKFSDFEDASGNVNGVTNVVNSVGGTVISVIRVVSVTIAMVMLLVIAMRYMLSSPGDRADIKKHAVAYVVGAFILFGVTGILTILIKFSEQISA